MSATDPAATTELTAEFGEIGPRSVVKIETNAKGKAQTKIAVYAGETAAEMERLSFLAVKIYRDLEANLGEQAKF